MDEDFHRAVLEQAPWGAIVASTQLDGRCLYLNPQFTQITGYELADVPTVQEWIRRAYPDPEYQRYVLGNWPTDTARDQMHRDVVYRVRCRDGSDKDVQFRAALVGPERMIVMLLDVTHRQAAERALRDSEERYRLLVETSPFGLVLHSGATIDFVNEAALRIVGAERADQIVGRPVLDFVHPDSATVVAQRMAEVREQGISGKAEEQRFVRLDGSIVDVAVSGALVPHRGKTAIQVVFTDITERKRMDEERRRWERRMQQAQRTESLALLAGGVAHDLNNLMVGILGHADLARRAAAEPVTLEEHLRAVVDTARSAAELAGQLLAYAGRRQLSGETIDLRELVAQSEGLLSATVHQRAELRLELDDVPTLEGDVIQLRQILLNLVVNAAESVTAPDGRITVRTHSVEPDDARLQEAYAPRSPAPVPHAVLEVDDDGAGMDVQTRERVFDPFFTTKSAGRGLGLAAALGIVRAHGAAISVQSELGRGTTFRTYFPAVDRTASETPAEDGTAATWRGTGTVLVVDDQPVVRDVASTMLEALGFDVWVAAGGREALALVARAPAQVCCVLLDLTMPDMSGEETFRELQSLRADLPIIVSSGFDEADTAKRFDPPGPAALLPKPYALDDLAGALRRALG